MLVLDSLDLPISFTMKITKRQEKQLDDVSQPLKDLVNSINESSIPNLPSLLKSNLKWETSKGTLFNWVSVLNKFDEILESITKKYNLSEEFAKPIEIGTDDVTLVVAILEFTHMLLENCTMKSVYASSHRLFDLLNSPTVPVIKAVLKCFVVLGKRFSIKATKKTILSNRKVSDRIYPFALFLPASTLTSNIGTPDSYSLIDFIKDNSQSPEKWKELEYIYYTQVDTSLKADTLQNFDSPSINRVRRQKPTPSPSKKRRNEVEQRLERQHYQEPKGSRSARLFVPAEDVRKLTLQQIFDKGSEKLPSKSWLRFSLKALMAKAFNSNSFENIRLRQDLVAIKSLAISILVSVHGEFEVTARIFEADPVLLSALIDLTNLQNPVPLEVRLSAVKALDCISSMKTWSSEMVRGLGGSVSHGLLFQNLRAIFRMLQEKDPELDEEFCIYFFNVISNLAETRSLSAILVSAGLIQQLTEFLSLRTDKKKTLSGAVALLDSVTSNIHDNVTSFKDNGGFYALIKSVGDELSFALENPGYAGGPPKLTIVHYTISFKQANYIRTLLKFVQHLIQKESGDNIRNLFDSPIISSVNKIFENVKTFGFTLLTLAINIVTAIINNEPTAYSILKDSGTIDYILENFETFFGESSDLLCALPNCIGAIALNTEGLDKVVKNDLIPKLFKVLDKNAYAKVLVNDDVSDAMGGSLEELARHYPVLKPIIMKEVVSLVERLAKIGTANLPRPQIYKSSKGQFYHSRHEEVIDNEEGCKQLDTWESIDEAYILENASVILGNLVLLSNSWTELMDKIPFKDWLSLICLEKSPFDYVYSNCMYPLNGILKFFDDERRAYVGSYIVDEAFIKVAAIRDFATSKDDISVFQRNELEGKDSDDLLNDLIGVSNLLFTFTDVYCNPTSLSATRVEQLAQQFSTEKGIQLLKDLGALLQRVAYEEYTLKASIPIAAADETVVNQFEDGFPPMRIVAKEVPDDNKHEKTSAKFKNSVQVRFTLQRLHSSISIIFHTLLSLPTTTRQEFTIDSYRGSTVQIDETITDMLVTYLDDDIKDLPEYLLVMIHTIQYCITDTTTDKILTVAAILYMQKGGFLKEKEILRYFWNKLVIQDNRKVKDIKPRSYVMEQIEEIVVSIVLNILVFFNKANVYEQLVNVPHSPLFYEGELDGSSNIQTNNLSASFVVQARILGFSALCSIFDEDGFGTLDENVSLPDQVVSEVVTLTKNIFSVGGERALNQSDGALFMLSWKQANVSRNRIDYLVKLGLTYDEAHSVLLKSGGDLRILNSISLPEGLRSSEKWGSVYEAAKFQKYEIPTQQLVPPQFEDFHTLTSLEDLRHSKSEYILDQIFLLAQTHPSTANSVSDFLLSSFLSGGKFNISTFEEDILQRTLEFIYSFEFTPGDSSSLKALLSIFRRLVSHDTVFFGCHNSLESFASGVIESLKADQANADWFPHALLGLERIVAAHHLPVVQELTVPTVTLPIKTVPAVLHINDALYDTLFETLTSIQKLTNPLSGYAVAKLLLVYASDPMYAEKVIESGIISQIVGLVSKIDSEGEISAPQFQNTFACLSRRCFESTSILQDTVVKEIEKIFTSKRNGSKSRAKDLVVILKEMYPVLMRAPDLFVEEFIKRARFNEFADPLRSLSVVYNESTDKDILMTDADSNEKQSKSDTTAQQSETASLTNKTGIVHVILTELMSASKENWFDDPELTPEEQKKKEREMKDSEIPRPDKVNVLKNKNCAHIIFLLRLLTELLSSYKQSKLEFLTFSKKQLFQNLVDEPVKPRSTSLNFILHQFLLAPAVKSLTEHCHKVRRDAVGKQAAKTIQAFVSTLESKDMVSDPKRVDPDFTFIRKFTIDSVHKILREINNSTPVLEFRYRKLVSLTQLVTVVLTVSKEKLVDSTVVQYDNYHMAKIILDSGLSDTYCQILADIDLNYPEYFFSLESIVNVLNSLGNIKAHRQDLFRESQPPNTLDEEEVEEDENDYREETPDLFQNSTLGMYDVAEIDTEEEYSDEDIGYGDHEDDEDDEDDDDDDEDELHGESLEIVYSGNGDSDDSALIGSDSDEVVDDGEEDDTEDISNSESDSDSSNSDADSFIEYDIDPDGMVVDEDDLPSDYDLTSEVDILEEVEGGEPGSELEIDEPRNDVESDYERQRDWDEIDHPDSEIDDYVQNLANQEDHAPIRTPGAISVDLSGLDAMNDGFQTDHDDDEVEDEDDENDSEDDHSIIDELQVAYGGRLVNRSYHNSRSALNRFESTSNRRLLLNFAEQRNSRITPFEVDSALRRLNGLLNPHRHEFPFDGRLQQEFTSKSTKERWLDSFAGLYNKQVDYLRVLHRIINELFEPSKVVHLKEAADAEEAKRQREAEEKARAEEEKKKCQEELELHQNETGNDETSQVDEGAVANREPIMVMIGDREVDIAGTDIDPAFFAALPDYMREEVFTEHIRERRAEASQSGSNTREIDPDFLNALPDGIREEILHQEAISSRLSAITNAVQTQQTEAPTAEGTTEEIKKSEKQKVYFTPLVDKAGVSALIRFVFVPQSFNGRRSLYQLLSQISINRQTRAEVLSYLIVILQYGITDQESLEKTFHHISAISTPTKSSVNAKISEKVSTPRTPTTAPGSLKSYRSGNHFPHRATPFIVASQILEALQFLLESDPQLRYYFLTEHEPLLFGKKGLSAKKPMLMKASKYPLNTLLSLLNCGLLKEKSSLMDLLSRIIQITTRPLNAMKKAHETSKADSNKKKIAELPSVVNASLRNVVTILVADDCSSRTFQQTLSAMQNLLVVNPGGKVFSSELSKYAKQLSESLSTDLTKLTAELSRNRNTKDFDSDTMVKFTSSSSDQSKLLRVLTALDYLFGEKSEKGSSENSDNKELTDIYNNLKMGNLWGSLSEALDFFETNKNITHIASALLYTIEALMVVCKYSKVKELQARDVLKYENKKCDFANEPIESLFFSFTDTHKKILNQMVRTNPKLMSGPFGMLVRNPKVLEFDNKRNYFDRKLHVKEDEKPTLQVSVRRDQVFLDSYRALFFKSKDEFRNSKLEINFKGEAGVDAGGVTREWYQVLSRQMFNPDYALFLPVTSDKTTFHPNRTSWVNPEHLSFFKFIGRVIGKAIYDNCFLDCHFTRDVYKSILGRSVSLKDLETIDLEYYKSLMWMLENDITDIIIETFSVETDDYGEVKTIDLVPNGREISVTEENKHEYVRLVVEYRLQTSVKEQVDNFLQGFHEIIPKELISIFDEQELELLISGLPDIDVDDWKNNTVYVNYSSSSKEVQYFWRAVRSFDTEERAKLLQFATGTSKVPLNGFKELSGSNGSNKFSIHKDFGSTDRLPSSHTCFNQIDLPAYDSYETLRGSLLLAITEGHEGFGIA